MYGHEGENLTLVCSVSLLENATKTVWRGTSNLILTINEEINPDLDRRDRLSLIKDEATGVYNLFIMNLNRQEDEGSYSCSVRSNSFLQSNLVNLAFHGI